VSPRLIFTSHFVDERGLHRVDLVDRLRRTPNCDGLDSTLRKEDGNTRSPVPSVPANTTCTGCFSASSPERVIEPTPSAFVGSAHSFTATDQPIRLAPVSGEAEAADQRPSRTASTSYERSHDFMRSTSLSSGEDRAVCVIQHLSATGAITSRTRLAPRHRNPHRCGLVDDLVPYEQSG
jgi:hypothetical protein